MIDAYEIGIGLALQDDVSAGLQVISRGLAEVDRAIDATSAKLANLTNAAQAVAGVAATGAMMRPQAGPAADAQVSAPTAETDPVKPSVSAGGSATSAPSPAQPTSKSTEPTVSNLQSAAPAVSSGQSNPLPGLEKAQATLPTAAPERDQTQPPAIIYIEHSLAESVPASPVPSAARSEPQSGEGSSEPAGPAPALPLPMSRSVAPGGDAIPARPQQEFTASIAEMATAPKAFQSARSASERPRRGSEPSGERAARATAPWSGIETRAPSPRPATTLERPAAPPARPQNNSEGLTGTVMLDGHMVGYWLAEQMAKEASRPPSGTSFFDPRQTPAWTASGSL